MSLERKTNLSVLRVKAKKILAGTKKGDSVAVNGVCLTVTNLARNILTFDIMRESLLKTTLGTLKSGSPVNLERALKINSRFSGHFVTGHIDSIGKITDYIQRPNYAELKIHVAQGLRKYIVPKGSICIDGISLTVGTVYPKGFSVYLIPFTKKVTSLGHKKTGECVNVEADIVAKYILNK